MTAADPVSPRRSASSCGTGIACRSTDSNPALLFARTESSQHLTFNELVQIPDNLVCVELWKVFPLCRGIAINSWR